MARLSPDIRTNLASFRISRQLSRLRVNLLPGSPVMCNQGGGTPAKGVSPVRLPWREVVRW